MENSATEEVHISSANEPAKVLIIDDHPLIRQGIVSLIEQESDLEVCGEAGNFRTGLDSIRGLSPDVVILDVSLPEANGIELMKILATEKPTLPVLVISMHDEARYATQALRAGARGYLQKNEAAPQVVTALRQILKGQHFFSPQLGQRLLQESIQSTFPDKDPIDRLTPREREILSLTGRGYGTREIATQLNLSMKTIETHRGHIKRKLHLQSTNEMVRYALEWSSTRS